MNTNIASMTVLVFLLCVSPVQSIAVMYTCAYPAEASASPAVPPFEFPPASSTLSNRSLPADGEEPFMKASLFEFPLFMHARHPGYSPSFTTLLPHFPTTGAWGSRIADKSTPPRLQDLASILFLGIGMLSMGILGRRIGNDHDLSRHHHNGQAPRHP